MSTLKRQWSGPTPRHQSSMRWAIAAAILLSACADGTTTESAPATSTTTNAITSTTGTSGQAADGQGCADVIEVDVSSSGDTYTFSVTVASADTGWDKYADAWEVRSPDGEVLGVRELAHPHVDEQPFTRSLSGVPIPEDLDEVVVAARDSVEGFCGIEQTVAVP